MWESTTYVKYCDGVSCVGEMEILQPDITYHDVF